MNGSKPGVYNSAGAPGAFGWKECQLQSKDAGKNLTFTVDTGTFHVNLDSGGCPNGMIHLGPYRKVANVFVLMLENHSFDNIFAMSGIKGIKAATTNDRNAYTPPNSPPVVYPVQRTAPPSMPTDPGHEFLDVVEQLAGVGARYPSGGPYPAINNSGFAANYATSASEKTGLPKPDQIGDIMKCFDTPNQLPVIYQLATEFAVCDHWFSSLPGPTWPNRFFLHGASSAGLDHSPTTPQITEWETVSGFTYPHGSIFDALNKAKVQWRLYNDRSGPISGSVPQVASIKGITLLTSNDFANFASDLQNPYSYGYTFIEPNYGDTLNDSYTGGSSQHPMDGVAGGERLIKATYEAIRNSPLWYSSLLIITYDEHGGFYDSVPPVAAVAPGDGASASLNQYGFTFTVYGVRVPAVVVSPYISKGTVDSTIYDHASVPRTLERLFGFAPLTQRDAKAFDVLHLLSLPSPRTDCPTVLHPPAATVASNIAAPPVLLPPAAAAHPAAATAAPAAAGAQPIPQAGNLPGFLGVALKTELELSGGTDAEKTAIIANFQQIRTQAQAQAYLEKVVTKAQAVQASGGGVPTAAPGAPSNRAGA
jgi:phospholipase C